jgi:hypothetical protein
VRIYVFKEEEEEEEEEEVDEAYTHPSKGGRSLLFPVAI